MKACPSCKSMSRHRMSRRGIAKKIPGCRAYECDKCGDNYIWNSFINRSFKVTYK